MKQLTDHPTFGQYATLMKFSGHGDTAAAEAMGGHDARMYTGDQDAQVLQLRVEGRLYFVFQGTNNPHGWLRNFKRSRVEVTASTLQGGTGGGKPLGKAHRGIVDSWLKIADSVLTAAQGSEQIVCLGHSAGGMLASLAALALAEDGHLVPQVVTCGKPRWCDRRLGTLLRQHKHVGEIWRIVLHRDLFAHLPLIGYQHETGKDGVEDGAKILYLDEHDMPSIDPGHWARLKSRFRAGGYEPTVDDLGGVPGWVIDKLKEQGKERIDSLLSTSVAALAALLGAPPPLAAVIRAQVQRLSIGGWILDAATQSVQDHLVATYEHVLHACNSDLKELGL